MYFCTHYTPQPLPFTFPYSSSLTFLWQNRKSPKKCSDCRNNETFWWQNVQTSKSVNDILTTANTFFSCRSQISYRCRFTLTNNISSLTPLNFIPCQIHSNRSNILICRRHLMLVNFTDLNAKTYNACTCNVPHNAIDWIVWIKMLCVVCFISLF